MQGLPRLCIQTLNPTNLVMYQTPDGRSLALAFGLCCLIQGNPLVQNSTLSVNSGENRDSYEQRIFSPYLVVALDGVYKCFICHNLGFSIEKGLETIFDRLELLLTYLQKEKISEERFMYEEKTTPLILLQYLIGVLMMCTSALLRGQQPEMSNQPRVGTHTCALHLGKFI